ncbi:unnamed protein product [Caenorhabditis nigoni]
MYSSRKLLQCSSNRAYFQAIGKSQQTIKKAVKILSKLQCSLNVKRLNMGYRISKKKVNKSKTTVGTAKMATSR